MSENDSGFQNEETDIPESENNLDVQRTDRVISSGKTEANPYPPSAKGKKLSVGQNVMPEEVRKGLDENNDGKNDNELEHEVRYRDTVLWSVKVLEQSVDELEGQLASLQNDENDEESEFKLRYEAQQDLNKKLEEQIKWYNQEVLKMKERTKKEEERWGPWRSRYWPIGNENNYDADLDAMNECELSQLVKQLERERNILYGDLRNKSWLLDNHAKEYYHFKELIKAYTGDLNHINRSLEQIWRERSKSRESGIFNGVSPMTSPGSVNWSNGESGIRPSQRILDPKKGPVRKTAGVRSLPRLDQKALEEYDQLENGSKRHIRSRSQARIRTKSLDVRRGRESIQSIRERNGGERETVENSAATSVEPTSDPSEDMTVESFASSVN